ncbi:phage virion morphogenesis protein [Paenibacillus tyrfis]|uniref:Uncharacterized protein n=1 Tax=Paenibacillus tyrfis TaxID=1501230 RepID=A0A081NWP9_9BACL|nr:hypothetical protein [Paenibacillus tyrfis]KEQ22872.1 hypothetical protein ET33_21240 [Paenibacillus tyrfis]
MSKAKRTRTRRANIEIDETTYLPDILKKLKRLTASETHIGASGNAELAMIAGIHEYGSQKAGIPPRSFIRSGRNKAAAAVSKLARTGLTAVVEGNKQPEQLLGELGELAKARVLKNFDKLRTPPLSPIYARRKGSNKLLIEEQQLRDSITYIIVPRRSSR